MNEQSSPTNGQYQPQPLHDGSATMPLPQAVSVTSGTGLPVPASEPPVLAVPLGATPVADAPQQPAAAVQDQPAAGLNTPAEAADIDVIEREWVDKAKAVVAATSQDPYKQVQEMNKLRADYMKKRYDKDIKLADE